MKKLLVGIILLAAISAKAQVFPYFTTVDSLKNYINGYIRNDARNAFTNLRLNTALNGIAQFLDSARLAWGGGGGSADGNNFSNSLNLNSGVLTLGRAGLSSLTANIVTTHVTEGTNLYFTQARARLSIGQGLYWNYNTSTGIGSVDTSGLFGEIRDTLTTRFGSSSLKLEQPNAKKTIATPKVIGIKSLTDFRALTGILVTDTEYVFVLTNYAQGVIQKYQYDPNDVTSADDSVTIIVAGTKRFRAVFDNGLINVKLFGAKGDNSTDDHDAIQRACDILVSKPTLPRNLYFPQGAYKISKPIIIYKWDGTNYQQCQVNLIGQEFQHWNDITTTARIRLTDTASFAIGVQQGRSMVIKGLSIEGPFAPPFSDYIEYYKRPFSTWASAYGVRDQPYSPLTGINIDPFGNQTGVLPADSGYTNYRAWYRGTGTNAGSSGVHVEQCRITGFTVGVGISISSLVQNGENIVCRDIAITQCKVGYASGQLQTKDNFIYNGISDDRVFAIVSGDYGNGHGCQPYIMGYNIAGTVISVCHGLSNQFPVSFQNVFAEGLYQIGDATIGAGSLEFINCNMDFALYTTPFPIPPYYWKGDQAKFVGCTMRYYDDSLNRRLYFKGTGIMFDNCWFDKPPLGRFDQNISSGPLFSFNECRTGNSELVGWKTFKGKIDNSGIKIVKYGSIDIEDGGNLTTGLGYIQSLKLHFDYGGMSRFQGLTSGTAITVDTIARQAAFSIATGSAALMAAGDYLLYGPSTDSLFGRVRSVNYSTGAIVVVDIPIGVKSGNFDLTTSYYEIQRGFVVGKSLNGSNVIDSVKFSNLFQQPAVNDRSPIGFPGAIITATSGTQITLSANAYYTRSQDYGPMDKSEKVNITSYYDLSHANLDGWNQLMPQNATWKIWTSPYTNSQHTYRFTKGGYIHMSTVSGPPTYWQSEWRLTADDNPAEWGGFEGGNWRFGSGADDGRRVQINGTFGAYGIIKATGMKAGGTTKVLTHETDSTIAQVSLASLLATLNINSGTYTPTLTNATNVASSSAFQCQWLQIGNTIHVSGKVTITPTAGSANTVLGISLPVASGFAATENAGGAGQDGTTVSTAILANIANNRVDMQFTSNGTGARTYWFTFTYLLTPP